MVISIHFAIDDILITKKTDNLINSVERLSKQVNIKCDLPESSWCNEYKIKYLEEQINILVEKLLKQSKKQVITMQITGTPDEIAEFMNLLKSDYRGDCTIEKDVNGNIIYHYHFPKSDDE